MSQHFSPRVCNNESLKLWDIYLGFSGWSDGWGTLCCMTCGFWVFLFQADICYCWSFGTLIPDSQSQTQYQFMVNIDQKKIKKWFIGLSWNILSQQNWNKVVTMRPDTVVYQSWSWAHNNRWFLINVIFPDIFNCFINSVYQVHFNEAIEHLNNVCFYDDQKCVESAFNIYGVNNQILESQSDTTGCSRTKTITKKWLLMM